MATLAIKGHEKRGKEVIEILEMLGGKNQNNVYSGKDTFHYYFIDNETGYIRTKLYTDDCWIKLTYNIFTLEEFFEKFPYKVGDKAIYNKDIELEVVKMYWDDKFNIVRYDVQGVVDKTFTLKGLMATHFLRYKDKTVVEEFENFVECIQKIMQECSYGIEKTMEEKLEQITLDIPDGYEFFGINDDNKVVLTKKHIQYPKNYKECCDVLGICPNGDIVYAGNWVYGGEYLDKHLERIRNFQKLLICRDAYLKIAGEEMGLGKPWEPDFLNPTKEIRYFLFCTGIAIENGQGLFTTNKILIFPTEEMRDAFYVYFESLIRQCKELL